MGVGDKSRRQRHIELPEKSHGVGTFDYHSKRTHYQGFEVLAEVSGCSRLTSPEACWLVVRRLGLPACTLI